MLMSRRPDPANVLSLGLLEAQLVQRASPFCGESVARLPVASRSRRAGTGLVRDRGRQR